MSKHYVTTPRPPPGQPFGLRTVFVLSLLVGLGASIWVYLAMNPPAKPPEPGPPAGPPRVRFETTMGSFVVEVEPLKAPLTVRNFLAYVDAGHYDGTLFHMVKPGFVIQGGHFDRNMKPRRTQNPIPGEAQRGAGAGLHNTAGTIAMARDNHPDSATDQFFINLADNNLKGGDRVNLDYDPGRAHGFAVFGRVVEGMDVVTAIGKVPTSGPPPAPAPGIPMPDLPATPVVIKSAKRL